MSDHPDERHATRQASTGALLRGIQEWGRSLGVLGWGSLVILLVLTFGILFLWQRTEWQSALSAVIAGLGATLGSAVALLEGRQTKARLLLVLAGGIFTAWFAYYSTSDLAEQLRTKSERLDFFRADLLDYLKPLPVPEIQPVLKEAGEKLRTRFNEEIARKLPFSRSDFDASRDLIELISKLDDNNGHVHYFLRKIDRGLGDVAGGDQQFYAYLTAEHGRTRQGALGYPPCDTPEGYCRERTAWIFHVLANDFYEDGIRLEQANNPDASARFSTALLHTCSAIKLYPPNGFNSPTQGISTRTK
jgi:hypothetical protein